MCVNVIGVIRIKENYKRRKRKRRVPNNMYDVLVKKCKDNYYSCLWKMKARGTINTYVFLSPSLLVPLFSFPSPRTCT